MAELAYNPQTGEVIRLDGNEWVPHLRVDPGTQIVGNPQTGEVMKWGGNDWVSVSPESPASPEGPSFLESLQAGLEVPFGAWAGGVVAGIGKSTGLESVEKFGREASAASKKRSAELMKGAKDPLEMLENGATGGEIFDYIVENFGLNSPQMLAHIGAGYAAQKFIPPAGIPGVFAKIGAFGIGAGASMAGMFTGTNVQRQMEEGQEPQLGKAFVHALPAAAADLIVMRALGLVGGDKLIKAATGPFLNRLKQRVGQALAADVPAEIIQQALERGAADLPLNDEKAWDEYLSSAIGAAAFAGPAGAITAIPGGKAADAEPTPVEAPGPPAGPAAPPPSAPAAGAITPGVAQTVENAQTIIPDIGETVGVLRPKGAPLRGMIEWKSDDGLYARVRYEDGQHEDVTVEDLAAALTEPPPPATPEIAPQEAGPGIDEETFIQTERELAEVDAAATVEATEARTRERIPSPIAEAVIQLERAKRLREAARSPSALLNDQARQDMIIEAGRIEREYGAKTPAGPLPKQDPERAERASMGDLGRTAVVKEIPPPVQEAAVEPAPAPEPPPAVAPEPPQAPIPPPEAPAVPTPPQEAEIAPETAAPTPEPTAGESGITMLNTAQIGVDAKQYQFKSGADTEGVTDRLQGIKKWEPVYADPILVHKRADGSLFVADGHQRLALAKRLGVESIPAHIIDEADGVSVAEARMTAAHKNISQGTGTAVDAAKIIRESAGQKAAVALPELPPRSPLVKNAKALSGLGEDAFGMVVNGAVPENHAAEVAKVISDPAEQVAVLDMIAKNPPANENQARLMAEQARDVGFARETETGLFGDEDIARSLVPERAKILDGALGQLRTDVKLLRGLNEKSGLATEVGNIVDETANMARAEADEKIGDFIRRLANRKGEISDALNKEARAVADGDKIKNAVNRFVRSVRQYNAAGTQPSTTDARPGYPAAPESGAPGRGGVRAASEGGQRAVEPAPAAEPDVAPDVETETDADTKDQTLFQRRAKPRDLLSEATDQGENLALPGLARADPDNILLQIEGLALNAATDRAMGEATNRRANERAMTALRDAYRESSGLDRAEADRNINEAHRRGEDKAVKLPAGAQRGGQGTLLEQGEAEAPPQTIPAEARRITEDVTGVVYTFPEYEEKRAVVQDAVQQIVRDMVGPGFDAAVFDELWGGTDAARVIGAFMPGDTIVAVSMESPDFVATGRHESLHALKDLGVIPDADWSMLERESERAWIKDFDIEQRYDGLDRDRMKEEGIAHAVGAYRDGNLDIKKPALRRALDRIVEFFDKVRNALAGEGFRSWRDVLNKIDRGDFAGLVDGAHGYRVTETGDGRFRLTNEIDKQDMGAFDDIQEARDTAIFYAQEAAIDQELFGAGLEAALTRSAAADAHAHGLTRYAKMIDDAGLGDPDFSGRGEQLANMNAIFRYISFPRGLAALDAPFSRYWNAWRNEENMARSVMAKYSRGSRKMADIGEEGRRHVHAIEELDRLNKTTREDTGRRIVARNEGVDAALSKDGDILALTPEETEAYFERRRLFGDVWNDIIEATARRMGYDGEVTQEAIEDAIKTAAESGNKMKATNLARVLDAFNTLSEAKRTAYVPLMRYGDHYIAVKPKAGEGDQLLGGAEETVYFNLMEGRSALDKVRGGVEKKGDTPVKVRERVAELRKKYPADKYNIFEGRLTPKVVEQIDLPALEKLVMATGMDDPSAYESLHNRLMADVYNEMKTGWKKQSRNVPGYSADFDRATSDYLRSAANNVAAITHARAVDAAYDRMKEHPNKYVRSFSVKFKERMNSPAADFAKFRKFGFFWYLWGSASSALVNSSQVILATAPYIGAWGGHGPAWAVTAKAVTETYGALKADAQRGFYIDIESMGRTKDEKEMLRRLEENGTLQSQITQELTGLNKTRIEAARGPQNVWNRAFDIGSSMFGGVEVANRAASALAAYRIAKNKKAVAAADKMFADNQLFQELKEQYGGVTPEMMAQWTVDETQFVAGKINRPPIATGPGAAILQFKTFSANYIRLLYQMMTRQGPAGKIAATSMLAALGTMSGLWGVPFADDIKEIYEFFHRYITGVDKDINREIRQYMTDAGLSKEAANSVLHGQGRRFGFDIGRRLGQGDLFPNASLGEVAGVPFSATIGRVRDAWQRYSTGQGAAAVAELTPQAIRNMLWATTVLPREGLRTKRGNRYMAPSEISTGDLMMKSIGIQPTKFSQRYEEIFEDQRLKSATVKAKGKLYIKLAAAAVKAAEAAEAGDAETYAEQREIFQETLNEHHKKLQDVDIQNHLKFPVNKQSLDRRMQQYRDYHLMLLKYAPREVRGEMSK